MGADDDADCVEHVWRLAEMVLSQGATGGYECLRCGAVLVRAPGAPFPNTA